MNLDLNKYRAGNKLKYYKISKGKVGKANNISVTKSADKSIGEMYKTSTNTSRKICDTD